MSAPAITGHSLARFRTKLLLAVVAAAAIAGCGAGQAAGPKATAAAPAATTHTVSGTVTLTDALTALSGCIGQGGYSDINAGAEMTVTNQSQTVLGSVSLGDGVPDSTSTSCVYSFSVLTFQKPRSMDSHSRTAAHSSIRTKT